MMIGSRMARSPSQYAFIAVSGTHEEGSDVFYDFRRRYCPRRGFTPAPRMKLYFWDMI